MWWRWVNDPVIPSRQLKQLLKYVHIRQKICNHFFFFTSLQVESQINQNIFSVCFFFRFCWCIGNAKNRIESKRRQNKRRTNTRIQCGCQHSCEAVNHIIGCFNISATTGRTHSTEQKERRILSSARGFVCLAFIGRTQTSISERSLKIANSDSNKQNTFVQICDTIFAMICCWLWRWWTIDLAISDGRNFKHFACVENSKAQFDRPNVVVLVLVGVDRARLFFRRH